MALSRVKIWVSGETLTAGDLNAEFQNILDNAASLISPLGGALDWDGYAHTLDAAGVTTAQSTASIGWSFTPGSKSGSPGTTGSVSNWGANTYTDSNTAGSGTVAAWTGHSFQRPTLAASNATVTTTDAATVYIANAPLAGSNETLTNAWALWVDAGNVRVDDNIVWLSGTSFKGTIDHANTANRTYTFPDADITVPGIATQAEVNAMTATSVAVTPNHNKLIQGTLTASTSGTSIDFTGIPSGVRNITIMLSGVSTNGSDNWLVQIGDSGGIETSGYTGCGARMPNGGATVAATSTAGILIPVNSAAATADGMVILTLMDSATFRWAMQATVGLSGNEVIASGASKSLSAELDRVRLTTTAGTNTFDAGAVNILYER